MRVLVWGNNPVTLEAAKVWLENVGLIVIVSSQPQPEEAAQESSSIDTQNIESQLLNEAKSTKVNYLVMTETVVMPVMVLARVDRDAEVDQSQKDLVTVKKLGVAVRGINVQTQEVDWSGIAQAPEVISQIDKNLEALTWEALGTAWGVLDERVE